MDKWLTQSLQTIKIQWGINFQFTKSSHWFCRTWLFRHPHRLWLIDILASIIYWHAGRLTISFSFFFPPALSTYNLKTKIVCLRCTTHCLAPCIHCEIITWNAFSNTELISSQVHRKANFNWSQKNVFQMTITVEWADSEHTQFYNSTGFQAKGKQPTVQGDSEADRHLCLPLAGPGQVAFQSWA